MSCTKCVAAKWSLIAGLCEAHVQEDVQSLCWRNYKTDIKTLRDVIKVQACVTALENDCKGSRGILCAQCVDDSWSSISTECDAFREEDDAKNYVQALCWKHASSVLSTQDKEIEEAREAAEQDQQSVARKAAAATAESMREATAIEADFAAP